jgi:hypothetical protein
MIPRSWTPGTAKFVWPRRHTREDTYTHHLWSSNKPLLTEKGSRTNDHVPSQIQFAVDEQKHLVFPRNQEPRTAESVCSTAVLCVLLSACLRFPLLSFPFLYGPTALGLWPKTLSRPRIRSSRGRPVECVTCVCVRWWVGKLGVVVRFVCVIRVPVCPVCPVCSPVPLFLKRIAVTKL